jgi:hypothetical protein
MEVSEHLNSKGSKYYKNGKNKKIVRKVYKESNTYRFKMLLKRQNTKA